MKFKASKIDKLINSNNDLLIQFTVKGFDKRIADMAYNEIKDGENIVVEAKERRNTRSLDQNAKLWALLTKLSLEMNGSKRQEDVMDTYCTILEIANIEYDYIIMPVTAENSLSRIFRAYRNMGKRIIETPTGDKREGIVYKVWLGSSKFDTKQMSELIDIVLDKCAEYGIYDSEIEMIRSER